VNPVLSLTSYPAFSCLFPEEDLGMFSMFDRIGAPHKRPPHGPPFLTLSPTLTNSDPNLKFRSPNTRWRLTPSPHPSPSQHTLSCQISTVSRVPENCRKFRLKIYQAFTSLWLHGTCRRRQLCVRRQSGREKPPHIFRTGPHLDKKKPGPAPSLKPS